MSLKRVMRVMNVLEMEEGWKLSFETYNISMPLP
jgi:hypothetical protein